MKKLKEFLLKMMTSGSGTSSKRFNGTIAFGLVYQACILFIVIYEMLHSHKLSDAALALLKLDAYLGTALLGIGILDKFKPKDMN